MFLNTIRNYFLPGCDVEKDEHGNAYAVMAMAEIVDCNREFSGATGNSRGNREWETGNGKQGILGATGNFRVLQKILGATENSLAQPGEYTGHRLDIEWTSFLLSIKIFLAKKC